MNLVDLVERYRYNRVMSSEYVIDLRQVNRTCTYRTAAGKLRPAVMTAVGLGALASLRVGRHGETYASAPRFDPATPGTAGWLFAR